MELLFCLFILAIVAAYVLWHRSSLNQSPPSDLPEQQQTSGKRSQSFDAQSAKQRQTATFVQGSAYVVDGDTLTICKTQIRLFGIDAPEMNHPYGRNAKWALVSLCKGQKIRAEILAIDAYGRTVGRCHLQDGRDLSAEMVKQGMALDWPKFSGGEYAALEVPGIRKKLWLADARQKGRMHVWEQFEASRNQRDA